MIKAEIKLDKYEVAFLSTLAENDFPRLMSFNDLRKAVKILQRIWLNINEEVVQ